MSPWKRRSPSTALILFFIHFTQQAMMTCRKVHFSQLQQMTMHVDLTYPIQRGCYFGRNSSKSYPAYVGHACKNTRTIICRSGLQRNADQARSHFIYKSSEQKVLQVLPLMKERVTCLMVCNILLLTSRRACHTCTAVEGIFGHVCIISHMLFLDLPGIATSSSHRAWHQITFIRALCLLE